MAELKDLLKHEIIEGALIFNNINELATKIAEEMKFDGRFKDNEEYIKKQRSISSFLHQVDNYERKCTAQLNDFISRAIDRRLEGQSKQVIENVQKKFQDTIRSVNAKTKSRLKSEDSGAELQELLSWADRAQSHFIITHKTAESIIKETDVGKESNNEVNEIQEILISRMRLFIGNEGGFNRQTEENEYKYDHEPDTQYFFYLPSRSECIRFWQDLFGLVTGKKGKLSFSEGNPGHDEVDNAFKKISGSNIITYKNHPPEAGVIPVVVYNAYQRNGCGFVLFYQSASKVSVAKMDRETYEIWMDKVFYPITIRNQDDMIVQWDEAKPVIEQEYRIRFLIRKN